MILTIAIPTYNRPNQLKKTLLDLVPQLTNDVGITVIDNHSDMDMNQFIAQSIQDERLTNLKVIRNRSNVGAEGNFAKTVEHCETPYIWILSDDDFIEPNAVEIILSEIDKYKDEDLVGINFTSNCCEIPRTVYSTITSTTDFVNKLDNFGNILFLPTTVYKTEEYIKYLRYVISGAYSMVSVIVPALVAISKGKKYILSPRYIISNSDARDWSPVQLGLSISALLEMPIGLKNDEYRVLGNKMHLHFDCLYPIDCMFIILRSVNCDLSKIDNYHRYIFKQLIMKNFEFRTRKLSQYIQYLIALFLMRFKIFLKLLFILMPNTMSRTKHFAPFSLFERK